MARRRSPSGDFLSLDFAQAQYAAIAGLADTTPTDATPTAIQVASRGGFVRLFAGPPARLQILVPGNYQAIVQSDWDGTGAGERISILNGSIAPAMPAQLTPSLIVDAGAFDVAMPWVFSVVGDVGAGGALDVPFDLFLNVEQRTGVPKTYNGGLLQLIQL